MQISYQLTELLPQVKSDILSAPIAFFRERSSLRLTLFLQCQFMKSLSLFGGDYFSCLIMLPFMIHGVILIVLQFSTIWEFKVLWLLWAAN